MLEKTVREVFDAIHHINQEVSRTSIPHSDVLKKDLFSAYGIDNDSFHQAIQILRDAHMVLVIEIAKEDKDRKVERIEGYVDADLATVKRLKSFYQDALQQLYQEEYRSRLLYHQIVQQIIPKMHVISNTPLGQIANKAIMLDEFEKLIQAHYTEFHEEWKVHKLRELIEEEEKKPRTKEADEEKTAKSGAAPSRRAIDSPEFNEFQKTASKESAERTLQIFGVEFFLRVNLRKYNFDYISSMVTKGTINRKNDLLTLREMVRKIKNNIDIDTNLAGHLEELYRLERTVTKHMHLAKNI